MITFGERRFVGLIRYFLLIPSLLFATMPKQHMNDDDMTEAHTSVGKAKTEACAGTVILTDVKIDWAVGVHSHAPKHKSYPDVSAIKKRKSSKNVTPSRSGERIAQASGYIEPVILRNFAGNAPNGWFPNDNRIAVANNGYIVSVINSNLAVFDVNGNEYVYSSFSALVDHLDEDLSGTLYDPTVLYDAGSDRFIVIILHSFTPDNSKVVVGFSQSSDPTYGWHFYAFTCAGDLDEAGYWFDYPNIAVSAQDLYISGNMFNGEGDYDHPLVIQIKKSEGYSGGSVRYQTWSDFKDANGNRPFTVVPISSGSEYNYGPGIYMVSTNSSEGSTIQLYDITDDLASDYEDLHAYAISTTPYSIGGNGYVMGRDERIDASDCRVRSGFYVNGVLHFAHQSDYDETGWNGINYNRLDVDAEVNRTAVFGNDGYDYCYPAVAWMGQHENDHSAMIGFLTSSQKNYPQVRVVSCDDQFRFSPSQLVKRGENYFGDFDETKESVRWGDYSGMSRMFDRAKPTVWMAGEYGRSDNKRGTWIAEVTGQATGVEEEYTSTQEQKASIFPNPGYDIVTIKFQLPKRTDVEINLYDINGRLVRTLFRDTARPGENILTFNRSVLTSGVYFVRIIGDGTLIKDDRLYVVR